MYLETINFVLSYTKSRYLGGLRASSIASDIRRGAVLISKEETCAQCKSDLVFLEMHKTSFFRACLEICCTSSMSCILARSQHFSFLIEGGSVYYSTIEFPHSITYTVFFNWCGDFSFMKHSKVDISIHLTHP